MNLDGATKQADIKPGVVPQPHQQRVSDRLGDDGRLLVYAGLGTGKSLSAIMGAEAAKSRDGGSYAIAAPASLRDNFHKELGKFTTDPSAEVMSYTGLGMGKKFKDPPETLILDECFPAGTIVDGNPIEAILEGDLVRSFNHASSCIEMKRVTRVSVKSRPVVLRLTFESGSSVVCTPNHPFFTENGYIPAEVLTAGDLVYRALDLCNQEPPFQSTREGSGYKEDGVLELEKLVSVEVHEQKSSEEFGGLCPGGKVYDITVEGNHNFFVDGFLVHNSHRLRNENSQSSKAVQEYANSAKRLMLLTGSPIVNRPSDLAPLVSMLTKQKISTKDFHDKFVKDQDVPVGFINSLFGRTAGSETVINRADDLRKLLKGHVDYQASAKPEGVDVNQETIEVPLTPAQERIQAVIRKGIPTNFLWKLDREFPLSKEESRNLSAFLTGLRQASISPRPFQAKPSDLEAYRKSGKLRVAVDRLKDMIKDDKRKKAIVYSNFIGAGLKPYSAALDEAKIPYSMYYGGMSAKKREEALKDYNSGKLRALLLGPAGAEGISTKGTNMIQLLDPHWNETRGNQAQGRGLRFDSHEGLPEDLKNVLVQRYVSRMPEPSWLGNLVGYKRQRTGDEIVANLASRKEKLNDQFRDLLKEVGQEPVPEKRSLDKFAKGVAGGPANQFVHYSLDDIDHPRSLSYEELVKDRTQGRWKNKPDKAREYVEGRRKVEDVYRKMLKDIGVDHDANRSFLYATMRDRQKFNHSDREKSYDLDLSPEDISRTFFDVVGLPDEELPPTPLLGQKGLDAAIQMWDKNKDRMGDTEYMGIPIHPRIEVITPGVSSIE